MEATLRPSVLKIWWATLRPKTLTAAIVPVVVGTAVAWADGYKTRWGLFAVTLVAALLIQIGTNFVNDACDFKKGADREDRLGPQRAIQAGLLTGKQVMAGALTAFALAFVLGCVLVAECGMPLLYIGLASILAAYAYTGGPYPLAYHGLGDLFVIVFFGLVAVMGSYFVQSTVWDAGAAVAGLCVGALATVLLAVNNLRDAATDIRVGKRTLAVRFGVGFARAEIYTLTLAPFVINLAFWLTQKNYAAATAPLVALPAAIRFVHNVRTRTGLELNRSLGESAALHARFGLLLTVGLLLS